MKNAVITVLWGFNAWYVANFAAMSVDAPSVGPLAAVAGAAVAWTVLTRRARVRTTLPASATA